MGLSVGYGVRCRGSLLVASERFLFCTQSGVLNYGNCSVDAAMAISDRLVTLRLEEALQQATVGIPS